MAKFTLPLLITLITYVSCRSRVHRVDETSLFTNDTLEDRTYSILNLERDLSFSSPSQNHFYKTRISHDFDHWKNCRVDLDDYDDANERANVTDGSEVTEVVLSFSFPFYGQLVDKVSISNKGFIFIGNEVKSSYIAPFMTNSFSEKNAVLYRDNTTSLTVQWEKMKLENSDSLCTFQLTLFDDGAIKFAYLTLPPLSRLQLRNIETTVGIAGMFHDIPNKLHVVDLKDVHSQTCIQITPLKNYFNYEVESEMYDDDDVFDSTSYTHVAFLPSTSVKHKREIVAQGIDEEDINEFSDVTLPPDNQDSIVHDHHYYYNSTMYLEKDKWENLWINLDSSENKNIHMMLSNSYRKGVTVPLSFDFPFYGHRIRNITITTGGFLFTGPQVHSWLAATQYIAPLMANFDPSLKNFSVVKYLDNGTALTVQWENVTLKDKIQAGNFTFQVTLLNSGDIAFVYKEVPVSVLLISDDDHPVKVGLSDAYIIDRTIFFMRRKTIYEYHRVDYKKASISSTTSIYFTALPTCITLKTCQTCLKSDIGFECAWCSDRCSDGIDRNRQDWILQGCGQQSDPQVCPETDAPTYEQSEASKAVGPGSTLSGVSSTLSGVSSTLASLFPVSQTPSSGNTTRSYSNITVLPSHGTLDVHHSAAKSSGDLDHVSLGTAGIIGVLFVVSMIVGFLVWVFYAYRNPHTTSGQLLIKYRPNQWHWSRGEARYMAASVHM